MNKGGNGYEILKNKKDTCRYIQKIYLGTDFFIVKFPVLNLRKITNHCSLKEYLQVRDQRLFKYK